MSATFHPFPRLPLELRLVIWQWAMVVYRGRRIHSLSWLSLKRIYIGRRAQHIVSLLFACKESNLELLSRHIRIYTPPSEKPRHYTVFNLDTDFIQIYNVKGCCHNDGTKVAVRNSFALVKGYKKLSTYLEYFLRIRVDECPSLEFLHLTLRNEHSIMASQRGEYLRFLKAFMNWNIKIDEHRGVMEKKWSGAGRGERRMPRVRLNINALIWDRGADVRRTRGMDVSDIPDDENVVDLITKWSSWRSYVNEHLVPRVPVVVVEAVVHSSDVQTVPDEV